MKRSYLTLLALMAFLVVQGSVNGFSVLLEPWEDLLKAPRSHVSLIYSLSLVFATLGVMGGYRIYPLQPPPILVAIICFVSAAGAFIAGSGQTLFIAFLGYGLLIGGAGGIGYGFALQIAAQAMPERKGVAMGAVNAFFGLGAMLFPFVFKPALASGGISAAMNVLAACLFGAGLIAGLLLYLSAATYETEPRREPATSPREAVPTQAILWVGYGTGAAAGFMAIGHAAEIVGSVGGDAEQKLAGPILVAFGSMLGGLGGGWLADRASPRTLLTLLPLLSVCALFTLSAVGAPRIVLAGLSVVGFCYGAMIAAYPAVVASYFGTLAASRIYGRIFTAWGLAGLTAPWFAGFLYDRFGDYILALIVAGITGLVSVIAVRFLPAVQPVGPRQGVPQDDAEAVKWYRKAAEQGVAKAQFNLGVMSYKGRGVPQDDADAVRWYRKAAEQGHASAQFNLGLMYDKGRGVPQDYLLAHMWLNLAAATGHEKSRKGRDIVAKRMTPAQIAEAHRLAREWPTE